MTEETKPDEMVIFDNCTRLPEAPAVAWTDVTTPNNGRWSITFRAGLPPEQARAVIGQLIDTIKTFETGALNAGWELNGIRGQATVSPPANGNGGALSFEADKLICNVTEGKTYWKVKGGKFAQYGVTVWPEVLTDAGFDPEGLDPTQVTDLAGYTAHYVLNENGKPQKVVKLEKAA